MYCSNFSEQVNELVSNGQFNWGTYAAAVPNINMLDAAKPWGFPVPRFVKNMRLKEWQAFQLGNDRYFLVGVVYNAKIMGLSQFIFIDKQNNSKVLFEKKAPSWKMRVAPHLFDTYSFYKDGSYRLSVHNDIARNTIEIDFAKQGNSVLPNAKGRFTGLHDPAVSPSITICHPFGGNRALYSHKSLMPMHGELELGDHVYTFDSRDSWMIIDDHKGYYPYKMHYDWLTTAGFTPQGDRIGLNLTDNQTTNHYRFNENCLWFNEKIELLPPVSVDRPHGVNRAWYLTDDYGRIKLKFIPCVPSSIKICTPIIRTDYHGPYGWIEGHIIAADGRKISFDSFFGMGEKKFIQC